MNQVKGILAIVSAVVTIVSAIEKMASNESSRA